MILWSPSPHPGGYPYLHDCCLSAWDFPCRSVAFRFVIHGQHTQCVWTKNLWAEMCTQRCSHWAVALFTNTEYAALQLTVSEAEGFGHNKQHPEVPRAVLMAAGSPPRLHCLEKNRSIPYSHSALRFGLLVEVHIPFVLFTHRKWSHCSWFGHLCVIQLGCSSDL